MSLPSLTHPHPGAELGHFTGNDVHPQHGGFDPASYAGYAPPGPAPGGQYYGYAYPPSSSSGYTPSAIAAKAFNTPPGMSMGGMPQQHMQMPMQHPMSATIPMQVAQGSMPIPMNAPSEEPSRRKKLLRKLSRGLLRPSTDPSPPAPSAPVLTPAQASVPSHLSVPPIAPTSSRKRSKSNASQTQADYQPISFEDFAAIVAETGSLSRYPALTLPGADGATHAHPHKRLPDRHEREERGRPNVRDMSDGGVMRNPSRTPKDDPAQSYSDSDTDSSSDPPSFGSDKTRWHPAAPISDAGHSTRSREGHGTQPRSRERSHGTRHGEDADGRQTRYPAASAPVGVGVVTHAAPPGSAYAESHKGSIHSSWTQHAAAGRPRSGSYYDDPDHYTTYAAGAQGAPVPPGSATSHLSGHGVPPGHPSSHLSGHGVPPGSASSHPPGHGVPPGHPSSHHSHDDVPPGYVGSGVSVNGHFGVPGVPGSHVSQSQSYRGPPPVATSSGSQGSRRSHRRRDSEGGGGGVDEFGYAGGVPERERDRDRERDGGRDRESKARRKADIDLERARTLDRENRERERERRREGGKRRHGDRLGDNDHERRRDRSRSRHSHLSQESMKSYGSYGSVPFETPPAVRGRSLSNAEQGPGSVRQMGAGDLRVQTGLQPSGSSVASSSSPKTILKAPSVKSQHSFAPSTAPSIGSTWSYHAPPNSAPLVHPPPGVVGSTSSSHHSGPHHSIGYAPITTPTSTSPYTAPVQPQPFTQVPPPQPYDNPYRTSPSLSPTHSMRHGHRHSVSGPPMSSSVPVGGNGYYPYAGWSAPPPGAPGSVGVGGGVPVPPGSAGGLPPVQHSFIDHSRLGSGGGVPRSHGSHSGSSRSGSGSGRSKTHRHRGRSRSVDALKAARLKDYDERMRILEGQSSSGSPGSSRRGERRGSKVYPPGPYGVPGAYEAEGHGHGSHHSHSPVERRDRERHRDRDRDRDREREREKDRDREGRGRSKSRDRTVLRKDRGRSESRRRRDDEDGDRERGESRSRSRPRHREDFDDIEKRERRRERGHDHERHIDIDEVMEIERDHGEGEHRHGPRVLKKSRSRHGSGSGSGHPSVASVKPSSSLSGRHHHHHHSESSNSPSHHRHEHSALVGSSASSRARHERRRESLQLQGVSHPRFEEGAFADPRRERESGMGVMYPVEAYPGRESSRSRERRERRDNDDRERRDREKVERRERRKTVAGVPPGGAGWYPV